MWHTRSPVRRLGDLFRVRVAGTAETRDKSASEPAWPAGHGVIYTPSVRTFRAFRERVFFTIMSQVGGSSSAILNMTRHITSYGAIVHLIPEVDQMRSQPNSPGRLQQPVGYPASAPVTGFPATTAISTRKTGTVARAIVRRDLRTRYLLSTLLRMGRFAPLAGLRPPGVRADPTTARAQIATMTTAASAASTLGRGERERRDAHGDARAVSSSAPVSQTLTAGSTAGWACPCRWTPPAWCRSWLMRPGR